MNTVSACENVALIGDCFTCSSIQERCGNTGAVIKKRGQVVAGMNVCSSDSQEYFVERALTETGRDGLSIVASGIRPLSLVVHARFRLLVLVEIRQFGSRNGNGTKRVSQTQNGQFTNRVRQQINTDTKGLNLS